MSGRLPMNLQRQGCTAELPYSMVGRVTAQERMLGVGSAARPGGRSTPLYEGRRCVTGPAASRIGLESESAAMWERTWRDETWCKDGEDTGGWS